MRLHSPQGVVLEDRRVRARGNPPSHVVSPEPRFNADVSSRASPKIKAQHTETQRCCVQEWHNDRKRHVVVASRQQIRSRFELYVCSDFPPGMAMEGTVERSTYLDHLLSDIVRLLTR